MAILSGIPVLNCRSIESTLDFYQKIFQFVVVKKRDLDGRVQWLHLMHGETTLMLQRMETAQSVIDHSALSNISLYFFINNIKELHHFIEVNYKNVSAIKLTDYRMQEFSLLDPEGNTVTAGMAVEPS